ncbi:MAG TPA: sensor histidine kinase [Firmicutes bacterium]|jgi:signal transduction histidine kinase|nr:sensor histidine kinase [Bacillota bacterium]
MTAGIIIMLLLLCAAQFIYIRHIKKQEKNWLDVLRGIRHGEQQKLFAKNSGLIADIGYELNGIIETNQAQISQLRKTDEANKQILTSLSHDVRTPLASLLGYLEALDKGISDTSEEREYIAVAYRKANDLKSYVDTLFEWFKLNSNEQKLEFAPADINELTREIIIEWLPVLDQEKVALSVDIGDNDISASIDPTAYSRIINNLIQNAVKHGHCTKLAISIKRHFDTALITVANNGQTIPAEQLPHIFERLYKGDDARSDKGSGLGLAITKELVAALHGTISVSSAQDASTEFSISLPVLK